MIVSEFVGVNLDIPLKCYFIYFLIFAINNIIISKKKLPLYNLIKKFFLKKFGPSKFLLTLVSTYT